MKKSLVFLLIGLLAFSYNSISQSILRKGTITTQNLVEGGTATANSAVSIPLRSSEILGISVTGTYTGALSVQVSVDGLVWVTLGGTQITSYAAGTAAATITSAAQGIYKVNVAGAVFARVTGLAEMGGTATVILVAEE